MDVQFIEPYASCPICASHSLQPAFDLEEFGTRVHWDRCTNCTLTFQNPRLAAETITDIYASNLYWGGADRKVDSPYHDYEQKDGLRLRQSRKRLAKIMAVTGLRAGRLLDVGCATGSFAAAAQEHGFLASGIEPSERMAKIGRERYRLAIRQSVLEECELDAEAYDIVTLWGTDSHFLNPHDGFARLADALKPGGILALNYQDYSHWIRLIFPRIKRRWNALFLLSEKSLRHLFAQLNLEILHHKLEWQSTTVDHIGRVLRCKPPGFLAGLSLKAPAVSFRMVIARKQARPVADRAA
jgi:SAM-dependent methyltransferase